MNKFQDMFRQAKDQWDSLQQAKVPVIYVGTATCGSSAGALEVIEAFEKEIKAHSIDAMIIEVGCIGLCYAEPLVTIIKPGGQGICYRNVTCEKVTEIVTGYLVNDDPVADYALGSIGAEGNNGLPDLFDTPVLKPQIRRILRNCGVIDPTILNHYIANGGYGGLAKALDVGEKQVIQEVKNSGLRGRGGAGFPTWRKWQFCIDAPGDQKYIICNADEGDPGAFMNR